MSWCQMFYDIILKAGDILGLSETRSSFKTISLSLSLSLDSAIYLSLSN